MTALLTQARHNYAINLRLLARQPFWGAGAIFVLTVLFLRFGVIAAVTLLVWLLLPTLVWLPNERDVDDLTEHRLRMIYALALHILLIVLVDGVPTGAWPEAWFPDVLVVTFSTLAAALLVCTGITFTNPEDG